MRAVAIERFGGPEVLQLVDVDEPVATGDQLVIDVEAAGVNFADTHVIEDSYLDRVARRETTSGELPLVTPHQ